GFRCTKRARAGALGRAPPPLHSAPRPAARAGGRARPTPDRPAAAPRPQLATSYFQPAAAPLTWISVSNSADCSAAGACTVTSPDPTVPPSLSTTTSRIFTGVPASSFRFETLPVIVTLPSPGFILTPLTSKGSSS